MRTNHSAGIRALSLLLAAAVTLIATAVGPYAPIAGVPDLPWVAGRNPDG